MEPDCSRVCKTKEDFCLHSEGNHTSLQGSHGSDTKHDLDRACNASHIASSGSYFFCNLIPKVLITPLLWRKLKVKGTKHLDQDPIANKSRGRIPILFFLLKKKNPSHMKFGIKECG